MSQARAATEQLTHYEHQLPSCCPPLPSYVDDGGPQPVGAVRTETC